MSLAMPALAWAEVPMAPPTNFDSTTLPTTRTLNAKSVAREAAATTDDEAETLDFTLAFAPYSAQSFGDAAVGLEIYQAIRISADLATQYAGAEVTAINVATGKNTSSGLNGISKAKVYLYEDFESEPFYTQAATLGRDPFTWNQISLDTPYTIEAGKSFIVAYSCTPISKTDYYITNDGIPRGSGDGCFIAVKQQGVVEWDNYSAQLGNLNIGMTLKSDNLPHDGVNIYGADMPSYVKTGAAFDVDLVLTGGAVNAAESVEVEYTVGSAEPKTQSFEFDEPLPFGDYTEVTLTGLTCEESGANLPLKLNVVKVNGNVNSAAQGAATLLFNALPADAGYPRNVIMEEGTGTWCGWCPAGMVMMEYAKENYPDRIIPLALHYNDNMAVNSAASVVSLFSGFPMVMLDRALTIAPTDPEALNQLDEYYNSIKDTKSVVDIADIDVDFSDDTDLTITAKVRFAVDIQNEDYYGIAFYVSRDHMGPYAQTNNYSGGKYGAMGGWEDRPSTDITYYDDVVRFYSGGLSGFTDAFPAEIKSDEEYEYQEWVKRSVIGTDRFYVTVLVIDTYTGEIVNAAQVSIVDTGVDEVSAASEATLRASKGTLTIGGAFGHATVCTLDGATATTLTEAAELQLPAGIYIVNIDGEAHKLMVR